MKREKKVGKFFFLIDGCLKSVETGFSPRLCPAQMGRVPKNVGAPANYSFADFLKETGYKNKFLVDRKKKIINRHKAVTTGFFYAQHVSRLTPLVW